MGAYLRGELGRGFGQYAFKLDQLGQFAAQPSPLPGIAPALLFWYRRNMSKVAQFGHVSLRRGASSYQSSMLSYISPLRM
jgi:hypothetical protein